MSKRQEDACHNIVVQKIKRTFELSGSCAFYRTRAGNPIIISRSLPDSHIIGSVLYFFTAVSITPSVSA